MRILETVLGPIVWFMELVLEFYALLFSSIGVSILLLSFTFALFLRPFQKIAHRTEQRVSEKMKAVNAEVRALKGELKGEKLFLATEQIYERNGYHPIQSVGVGASFFVMLPVLVSAILLFTGSEILTDKSFLFIDDLSKPDGFLGLINVLPLLMCAITLIDAKLRFKDDRKSQHRFLFISLVLLVIVYNLASGLVLYWIGSNIMSFITSRSQSQ
jgi:membrane protein insertase Oxa1/YidC/SpoIIIJ|tara:strand:+ start:1301 stop:1945 length:645 start_codon:yes stop_codon:yes gene_type:complete